MFYTQFDDDSFMSKLEGKLQAEFQQVIQAMSIEEVVQEYLEEKGKTKEKYQVARLMIADDKPLDEIMKYTGLTSEQINELKADLG